MIKKYIKRTHYLERIRPFMNKDVIKVLVGQRRVGKSYLLLQIMDELVRQGVDKNNILYINKELHEFDAVRDYRDLLHYIKQSTKGRKKTALFIDEIQGIAQFEKALRDLQATGGYDIYCTGSNANLLSGELATYLSGRYVEIEVYSLSYPEFLIFHKLENNEDSLLKYIKYGGLPYLINLELSEAVVYDYLKSISNTILFKDVVARYSIRNVAFLERLVEYVADNVGSLVSAKKISDFLKSQKTKISPNIVLNYLSFLSDAFLIFKVRRSEIGGKRLFEINDKYYFQDCGLRHALVGYRLSDINKVLENIVYMHLRASGYTVTVGQMGAREVDFVGEKKGERLYVQVAYLIPDKKTWEREFGNLLRIADNYPKFVVSMDRMIEGGEKGIRHMHFTQFIKTLL
ncbi:MAG: ATP-binding protein P-loopNTPAse superfamily [Nitrospirae bacterium]|nr:MAG: ATP-binding protein P-loopNTPAse superfamily [Nitrospirota bacterium]